MIDTQRLIRLGASKQKRYIRYNGYTAPHQVRSLLIKKGVIGIIGVQLFIRLGASDTTMVE